VTPGTKAKLIALVGGSVVKLLCATLRFRIHDPGGFYQLSPGTRFIGIFWHNRLLVIPSFFKRYMHPRRASALTSPSKDGEILAAYLARFGIGAIRGSSSRRGMVAMLEMKRAIENGSEIAITPDGPRGPRYHLSPGVIALAQNAGVPVVPISVAYSRYWQLKSWDAFQIPKPFATVDITMLSVEKIPHTDTSEAFEEQRTRLEGIMRAAHPEASSCEWPAVAVPATSRSRSSYSNT
jgi:lysophospholipid acyltransferase (LPLAT)-like uncharacterized protein